MLSAENRRRTIKFCSFEIPQWNSISISGYHIREAGSTAVQEVAFTLADGIEYVKAAQKAGLDVDSFAGRVSFFFSSHNDLLEEVAKFRAARRIWAKIMKERFHAKYPRSMMLRFHTQTNGSTLTAQQPENNVARVTLQALAAVLGGTQSLHTNSYDEALGLPTEKTVRVAPRTQQIIAHESGTTNTVDPLAGSYYVEYLTDQIEERVRSYIDRIDKLGGMINAIEHGFVQKEIQDSAYQYQREIEAGERIVVGVNKYHIAEDASPELLQADPRIRETQSQRIADVKANRSQTSVEAALRALAEAAKNPTASLMPLILEAARSYATIGEMCDVLRAEFGEYKEVVAS